MITVSRSLTPRTWKLTVCLDSVIWMGDFNYRIGLGLEKAKELIKVGDLETMYENDQVRLLYADVI
jgi:hypothetical protein